MQFAANLCSTAYFSFYQKLVFESSEAVSVVSTFDDLGLKEDLVRGIYAYSASLNIIVWSES